MIELFCAAAMMPPGDLCIGWALIDKHPGYAPYIGHINYRQMADFVIDQSYQPFDPDLVQQGDIIYVSVSFLDWFEREVHDCIKYPYILVSCDVGDHYPQIRKWNRLLYDPKCAAWFGRNLVFSYHYKLHQLAWGQDLWFWNTEPEVIQHLAQAEQKKPFEKKHLLYMNHYPRSFGDRDKIVEMFEDKPFCFARNSSKKPYSSLAWPDYYADLGASTFVLSPLGLETDSVRTWEALVLDCIPIVEHTFLDPIYDGMPVVMVHDWKEIDEAFLQKKQIEMQNRSTEKAYFAYWEKMIKDRQEQIRKGDLSASQLENSCFPPQDLRDLTEILQQHPCDRLIYRGCLASIRTFELANALDSVRQIDYYDRWLDISAWLGMGEYLHDKSLLKNRYKINFVNYDFQLVNASTSSCPIFLDLSYFRSSLLNDSRNYRHSLKSDILELFLNMQPGSLLCGNMAQDQYVAEVLERLAEVVPIQKRGNIWFANKNW